jgi:hypothetical protein
MNSLEPEYPGIVRLLADYYMKLKNERGGDIPVSKESKSYKVEIIAELESDLDTLVNVNISFEKNHVEIIRDVYDKYRDYHDFDENSVKRGEALSRNKFTKYFLKNYKDYATTSVQRVRGCPPSRVFVGVRLKTLDEIAAEGKEKENALTQTTPPPPAQKIAAPATEPTNDINPFS